MMSGRLPRIFPDAERQATDSRAPEDEMSIFQRGVVL
jgi:hypothetical protein